MISNEDVAAHLMVFGDIIKTDLEDLIGVATLTEDEDSIKMAKRSATAIMDYYGLGGKGDGTYLYWDCAIHLALEQKLNRDLSYADLQFIIGCTVGVDMSAALCAPLDIDPSLCPEDLKIALSRRNEMKAGLEIISKHAETLHCIGDEGFTTPESLYDEANKLAPIVNAELHEAGLWGTHEDEKLALLIVAINHNAPFLNAVYKAGSKSSLLDQAIGGMSTEALKSLLDMVLLSMSSGESGFGSFKIGGEDEPL